MLLFTVNTTATFLRKYVYEYDIYIYIYIHVQQYGLNVGINISNYTVPSVCRGEQALLWTPLSVPRVLLVEEETWRRPCCAGGRQCCVGR